MKKAITKATMKDLCREERPYEKCLSQGAKALSDTELLAVMIRTGSCGETALALAGRLLSVPGYQGLSGFARIPVERLLEIRGVGRVKAVQLKCLAELAARIAKTSAGERLCFHSPETIADYFMEELRYEDQEELVALFLDTRNRLIGEKLMFKGTVNASLISPREIFLQALELRAVRIVMVHNHPSGDPTPSREDIYMTERVRQAGELLGIQLLDHLIIGDGRYISIQETGILSETERRET